MKLTISSKSWHYRFFCFFHQKTPSQVSLCGYFWTLVLGPPAIAFSAVVLSPFIFAYWIGVKAKNKLEERRERRGPKPTKPPSLVTSFVKAKKARVCPLIQVD